MHSRRRRSKPRMEPAFMVAALVGLAGSASFSAISDEPAGPGIDIRASTDGISVEFLASTRRTLLTFSARVVGPDRYVFRDKVDEPVLPWIPRKDLADGH